MFIDPDGCYRMFLVLRVEWTKKSDASGFFCVEWIPIPNRDEKWTWYDGNAAGYDAWIRVFGVGWKNGPEDGCRRDENVEEMNVHAIIVQE